MPVKAYRHFKYITRHYIQSNPTEITGIFTKHILICECGNFLVVRN